MSDTPQGPDWWQASDDKWYPPPRPEMPGDATAVAAPGATAPGAVAPAGPPTAPAGAPTAPPGAPPTAPAGPPMAPPAAYPQGPPSGGYPAGPPTGPPSGPYGAPSGPQPPGAPQQNRTPLYIAIGVVAVIALIGIVLVVTSGDDDDPASPTIDPPTTAEPGGEGGGGGQTPVTDGPETTEAPSGDATVELVDSGFSNFDSGWDGDERSAAYGFIVENTGDDTATDVRISISAYDANDNALASDSQTIYVLRPGQRMGVGDEFYGENFASDVARIDVQVSESSDSYFADDVPDTGELTAEGVSTASDDYGMTTTFTAKSTFEVQIDNPSAYAIYRNASGEIVGGSRGYLDFVPANGSTAAEVTSYEPIPGVDSTEVYIDPGYF